MRVSRSITFAERYKLQFIAEGFNLTNRTNYASVNNIVGASFAPPFSVHGTAINSPSQPLGFTAAFPKRELQVGIHFDFEQAEPEHRNRLCSGVPPFCYGIYNSSLANAPRQFCRLQQHGAYC